MSGWTRPHARVSGRPGRLPAQAPHRSGRAEFPHPALRAHGFAARRQAVAHLLVEILASSAIRCSDVWMDTRFDALSIFPSTGSMPRRPLPSSGSLEVRFPGLIGTMRRSDFLPSIPGGSLTRPPVPPSCCFFAPAVDQHCPRRAWVLVSRVPDRLIQDGDHRISRVPVRSSRYMPCSHQTPVGPERQAFRRSRYCLPLVTQRRLPRLCDFGAQ